MHVSLYFFYVFVCARVCAQDLWREVSGLLANAKRSCCVLFSIKLCFCAVLYAAQVAMRLAALRLLPLSSDFLCRGWLRRQTREELRLENKDWNFDELETQQDVLWTAEGLEDASACAHRAYQALCWAWQREEDCIAIVAHGGILSFLLNEPGHAQVSVSTEANKRFHNCEMRSYILQLQNPPQPAAQADGTQSGVTSDMDQAQSGVATVTVPPLAFTISPLPDQEV